MPLKRKRTKPKLQLHIQQVTSSHLLNKDANMIFDPARVVLFVGMQIVKVMYFGVFAYLDEA